MQCRRYYLPEVEGAVGVFGKHKDIRRQRVVTPAGRVTTHRIGRVRWRPAAVTAVGHRAGTRVLRLQQTGQLQPAVVTVQPDERLHCHGIARRHGLRYQRRETHLSLAERPRQCLVQVVHQPGLHTNQHYRHTWAWRNDPGNASSR